MPSNQNMMMMDTGASDMKMNATFQNSYGRDTGSHSQQMEMQGSGMVPERGRDTMRRSQAGGGPSQMRSNSSNPQYQQQSSGNNSYTFQQAMSDHFDHYKRPPSRDTSVDRFGTRNRSRTRGATPELAMTGSGGGVGPGPSNPINPPQSRAQSRARTPFMDNPSGGRTASNIALDAVLAMESSNLVQPGRGQTPSRMSGGGSGGSRAGSPGAALFSDTGSVSGSDLEGLRFRGGLGQEIPSTPYTPKRTESLFLKPAALPKGISGGSGATPMVRISYLELVHSDFTL